MKQAKKLVLNRRLIYLVVALVGALVLWAYVRSDVNPYGDRWVYRVPVTFQGQEALAEERDLILVAGEDATIDLHLYGKRLDTASLNRSNIQVVVDLSTIRSAGTYSLDYDILFPDTISANAISVNERSPSSVQLTMGKLRTRTVDVIGSGGSPAEGFLAETMVCTPDSITLRGPEEVVSTIHHAAVYLDRENLERTVNTMLDYTLIDADGNVVEDERIVCEVGQIAVELPIVATKEIPLTVELLDGGGATSEDAVCEIHPTTVTIAGDAELLKGINQIQLGTIDLSEIFGSATLQRSILLPNDTQNLSGEEEATITVELRGLDTRTIRTTNIELINQPEDRYSYTAISSSLSVVIRGRSNVVEQIYPANLRVVADMSDYSETGQYKVPVEVYIDGYSSAGILHEGEYAIVVAITEKPKVTEPPASVTPNGTTGEEPTEDGG